MSWVLYLVSAAFGIYVAYNCLMYLVFDVPHSLSMTYYLLGERKSWLRYCFPALIFIMVVCLMPGWIEISEGSAYQFTSFLSATGLAFVGAAPTFLQDDNVYAVHTIGALVSALFAILWIVLVAGTYHILIMYAILMIAFMLMTKSTKTSYIYWLENIAFLSTFTSIIKYYFNVA